MRWPAPAATIALCLAHPLAAESVVAARSLPAQTILAPEDVLLVEAEIPGALAALDAAVGLQTRTAVHAGRPILAATVAPPAVVTRNAMVTLVYSTDALMIEAEGRALATAREGETVRALNLASKMTVSGTVDAAGRVHVGGHP